MANAYFGFIPLVLTSMMSVFQIFLCVLSVTLEVLSLYNDLFVVFHNPPVMYHSIQYRSLIHYMLQCITANNVLRIYK